MQSDLAVYFGDWLSFCLQWPCAERAAKSSPNAFCRRRDSTRIRRRLAIGNWNGKERKWTQTHTVHCRQPGCQNPSSVSLNSFKMPIPQPAHFGAISFKEQCSQVVRPSRISNLQAILLSTSLAEEVSDVPQLQFAPTVTLPFSSTVIPTFFLARNAASSSIGLLQYPQQFILCSQYVK
ncbi:hypothetical protein WR25_18169 [Diploscapter pachys]|uniref:Uncharacterized protein n=1 Tax=Diploscapter pachys TaxID=2018661 RepID=A0A2A2JHX1_9BILA|nr:hypothetical protein WR25_18169 [Diploscapter pachys]